MRSLTFAVVAVIMFALSFRYRGRKSEADELRSLLYLFIGVAFAVVAWCFL